MGFECRLLPVFKTLDYRGFGNANIWVSLCLGLTFSLELDILVMVRFLVRVGLQL